MCTNLSLKPDISRYSVHFEKRLLLAVGLTAEVSETTEDGHVTSWMLSQVVIDLTDAGSETLSSADCENLKLTLSQMAVTYRSSFELVILHNFQEEDDVSGLKESWVSAMNGYGVLFYLVPPSKNSRLSDSIEKYWKLSEENLTKISNG